MIDNFLDTNNKELITLKEKERKLAAFLACIPDAFLLFDQEGILVECNPVAEKLIGQKQDKLIGKAIDSLYLFAPPFLAKVKKNLELCFAESKRIGPEEIEMLIKDSSASLKEVYYNPLNINDRKLVLITAHDLAERYKLKIAVEAAQQQYETLINSIADGIAVLDKNEFFTYANPAAEKIFGVQSSKLVGRSLFEFLITDYQELINSQNKKRLAGITSSYEICIKREDGELRWLFVTASPRFDQKNNYDGSFGICHDITYRKNIEEALKLEKERAQHYFDIADVILLVLDRNGIVQAINKKGCLLLEYNKNDIVGRNWFDHFVPPCLQEDISKEFPDFMHGMESVFEYQENYILTRQGQEKLIRWHNALLHNQKGEFIGTVSSGQDITSQRNAEQALQESEETFRVMSSQAKDGIIMIDNEGKITFWNQAAAIIFGYEAAEIIGKELHSVLAPGRYYADHLKAFKEFRTTGQGAAVGKTLELNGLHKNHYEFPFELSMSSVFIRSQWHAIGIVRDITERKFAERELIEAREAAVQASQSKSQFLASMSHEIRTPMNAIIGMASLLMETELNTEQKHFVQVLQNAGENLLYLINDILDLSKVEAGHIELETIKFDLIEQTEKILDTLALKTHEKGLELIYEIQPAVPRFLIGDAGRLSQILINLMGNAIKFTKQGEIVIRVSRNLKSNLPGSLLFQVSDTGIGIPKDKQAFIFEHFVQADSSITKKYGGTGLGLAISKKLCELMHGSIGVQSEVGKGSTFFFTAQMDVPPQTGEQPDYSHFAGKHGLIIDDCAVARRILKRLLEQWGMIIDDVPDADTALSRLRQPESPGLHYDFLLVDDQMPGMNGFTMLEEAKKIPGLSSPAILMLTSTQRISEFLCGPTTGVFACLIKPIKQAEFYATITSALSRERPVKMVPEKIMTQIEDTRSLRILLVEDTRDNRLLIQAYLKKLPYLLDTAENGEIAVEKFKTNQYDVVLMDIQMPVMDGYTATGMIRLWEQQQNRKSVPIIALTAYALQEEINKSINAGCTAHLSKPIKKEILIKCIIEYTGGSQNE